MGTDTSYPDRHLACAAAVLCVALLGLILAAGCGGGDNNTKAPPKSGSVMAEALEYTGGVNPALAATADGWVVEFHEGSTRDHIWSNVGRFAEDGSFSWLGEPVDVGPGVEPGVAMADDGRIVAVHRARNGNGLWYSVGQLNKDSGKIEWLHEGDYDTGSYPNVVLFNDGWVLETHLSTASDDAWYMVGQINAADNTIAFSGARSLEGSKCLAAFKDTDKLVQLSTSGYRFGRVDGQNGSILWMGSAVESQQVSSTRERDIETNRFEYTPVPKWYGASAYAYGTSGDYRVSYVVCGKDPISGRGLYLGRAKVRDIGSNPVLDETVLEYMGGGEQPALACSGARAIQMHKSTTLGSGLWYSTGNL